VAWAEVYLRIKWNLDPSSRLATIDMGRKVGPKIMLSSSRFAALRPASELDSVMEFGLSGTIELASSSRIRLRAGQLDSIMEVGQIPLRYPARNSWSQTSTRTRKLDSIMEEEEEE